MPSSFFSSKSVAITRAPSAANASAMARPIPCPAAVMSASLPCRRKAMACFSLRGVTGFAAFGSRGSACPGPMPPFTRSRVSSTAFARQMGSVVVPWHALLRDAMIFDGWLENHAVGELIDHAALDLLPRRLARRIFPAAVTFEGGAALRELGVGDQHVRAAVVEIDAHAVTGLEQREAAPRRRLGRGIDDRRR